MRITWTEGRYSSHSGCVNGLELFTINWGTTRQDPKPWKVRTRLPIVFKQDADATIGEAKARAERQLMAFLDRIGASFDE